MPEDRKQILNDLYETITIYDLKATNVQSKHRADGKYDVQIDAEAHKYKSDGKGKESETALNNWIDVGVLAKKEKNGEDRILALEKKRLGSGKLQFHFVVNEEPDKAASTPRLRSIILFGTTTCVDAARTDLT